jgi:surfactin family lipopeptide synthetase A
MNLTPLTLSQYRILIESKLRPNSFEYNNILYFYIQGKLNLAKLKEAIGEVEHTYPELTAYIVEQQGEYYQALHEQQSYDLPIIDISTKNYENSILNDVLNTLFLKGFNLNNYPLYRYIIVKVKNDEYVFGLSWHHLLVDALSVYKILGKIEDNYNDSKTKEDIDRTYTNALSAAYRVESAYLSSSEYIDEKQYWFNKLKLISSYQEFSSHHRFLEKNEGKRITYYLTKSLCHQFMAQKERLGCSLFIMMSAVMIVALHKQKKKGHYILPYSINVRHQSLKNAIGYFVNTLPLAGLLRDDMTFIELVTEIREQRKLDRKAQSVPLMDLIKHNRKELDINYRELLSISLNQFTYLSFKLHLEGCTVYPMPINDIEISTDLIVRYDLLESLLIEIDYNTEANSEEYINQFLDNLNRTFTKISFNPHDKISK